MKLDIVDRLRGLHDYTTELQSQEVMAEAADEIEQLRRELDGARCARTYWREQLSRLTKFTWKR